QSGIQDALRSLETIDIHQKQEFFNALRANLVSSDLEWAQFPRLFDHYWQMVVKEGKRESESITDTEKEQKVKQPEKRPTTMLDPERRPQHERKGGVEQGWMPQVGYSPFSLVEKADVGKFDKEDIAVAQLALKRIMSSFRTTKTRRMRKTHQRRSLMDFPKVARKSLKYGGIPMELYYREKKKRLKRLVILADVSGSMERYARFVIPFLLGLRGIGPRAEVFVFSTSLAHVTHIVRHLEVEKALREMVKRLPEWSGGTRIGYSLHQFNQKHGSALLNQRTIVLILSDGWDLGAKELLRREMAHIGAKACCTIWLNPLVGDPAFQPICRGMQTVMPYVDYLLPANSLESLKRVGHILSRLMVH
ncbi:MAG TPA: VWA domain-containing protein, partial [Desulfobacterales bacterium]|nr:VWA domain-containing protein [Desulfobacterales bacterium]